MKIFAFALMSLLGFVFSLNAQESIKISGTTYNSNTKEALGGVSVRIKGKTTGVITANNGSFTLTTLSSSDSVRLIFSCIGYDDLEKTVAKNSTGINLHLEPHFSELKPLVFSASRTKESILRSPISIEHYSNRNVLETPSIDAYEGLRILKGMDLVTNGLNYKQVNTRGFSGSQNTRFLQLVDGVDQQETSQAELND